MKKAFKFYAIAWIILVAAWNLITFALPDELTRASRFDGAFTAGYAVVLLSLIGQFICAYFAFQEKNKQKFFYHIPLITISGLATIVSVVAGVLCMAVPQIPYWVGMIVCVALLAYTTVAVLKAKVAAYLAGKMDDQIRAQTWFVRSLTADAQSLLARAHTDAEKAEIEKVYDAVRYSDPMSHRALCDLEEQITLKFGELSQAIEDSSLEHLKVAVGEFLSLMNARNQKCRLLK